MDFKLTPVAYKHLHTLYDWSKKEKRKEYHTCLPINKLPNWMVYSANVKKRIRKGEIRVYVLLSGDELSGQLQLFNYNPRNHSAEFGYYVPPEHRGRGFGLKMVTLFLELIFAGDLKLNKVYATTASNNIGSIRLLQRLGFHLDGRLREHCWIEGGKYDQFNYSLLRAEWQGKKTTLSY